MLVKFNFRGPGCANFKTNLNLFCLLPLVYAQYANRIETQGWYANRIETQGWYANRIEPPEISPKLLPVTVYL